MMKEVIKDTVFEQENRRYEEKLQIRDKLVE